MTAPVAHDFTGMVGSQADVRMVLHYQDGAVTLDVAGMTVMVCPREQLAYSLVASFPTLPMSVGDDYVVLDIPTQLPLHLVLDLADVEEFLDRTFAVDPERVDPAELSIALVGVL